MPAITYRADIDGLRAIAVLAVVFFHAGFAPFSGGFLGVDVFFVISGYLITSIIVAEIEGGRFSLAGFYERRARRILPALIVVLAASFAVAAVTMPPGPFEAFSRSALAALAFLANIYFWSQTDYFSEPAELTPLLHTWSLAVEEQFYIVFPLLLMLAGGGARRIALVALLAVASLAAALAFRRDAAAVFYLAHFRAWELLVGALIVFARRATGSRGSGLATALGIAMIIAAVVLAGKGQALAGALAATSGAGLVLLFGGDHAASRVLGWGPFRAVGLISYSLYLWHQPIFVFARFYLVDAPTVPVYMALIGLAVVLSIATWRLVEQPFRRGLGFRPFALATSGGLVAVAAAAFAVLASAGLPARYGAEQLAILSAAPVRGVAVRDGRPCRRPLDDACIIGDAAVRPTFAVVGDSHGDTLTEPLSHLLGGLGLSAYVFTNAGCPFARGLIEEGGSEDCLKRTDAVIARLSALGIENVIVHDRAAAYFLGTFDNGEGGVEPVKLPVFAPPGFGGSPAERVAAVNAARRRTLEGLLDSGIRVFYIAPVPEVGWHVPRTLIKAVAQGRLPLTTSLERYLERNGSALELARALDARPGFAAVLPHEVLCDSARCHTHRGGRILYTDTDHLSADGAQIVVDRLAPVLRARTGPGRPTRAGLR